MWAQVHSNEVVRTMVHPIDMEVDGVTHPKSIFTKWSTDDLKNIGVYPYSENTVDGRYHYSGELTYTVNADDVVGSYAAIDRDIASLKAGMITTAKQAAAVLLSKHDWMAIREMEGGEAMPADVKTYRAAVRTESNDKETEINALADMDAIKAYEATSYTEVRKLWDNDAKDWSSDTESYTQHKNMTSYYVAVDPTADADPSFVSLTKD
tara:strand:- start:20710 stop:21336 length:627 start_codon:yes stop_codon:yes gene_type:complete